MELNFNDLSLQRRLLKKNSSEDSSEDIDYCRSIKPYNSKIDQKEGIVFRVEDLILWR